VATVGGAGGGGGLIPSLPARRFNRGALAAAGRDFKKFDQLRSEIWAQEGKKDNKGAAK
jgi:hypothetical protein